METKGSDSYPFPCAHVEGHIWTDDSLYDFEEFCRRCGAVRVKERNAFHHFGEGDNPRCKICGEMKLAIPVKRINKS